MKCDPSRSKDETNLAQRQGGVDRSIMMYPNPNIYSTMDILAVLAAIFLMLAG
jgi:hypothetical protein